MYIYMAFVCMHCVYMHTYICMYIYRYIVFFTSDNEIPSPTDRCTVIKQRNMKNVYAKIKIIIDMPM